MSYPRFNFSGYQECVKCGCADTHWVRYGADVDVVSAAGDQVALDDHLLRTCTRCQYEWREACLDA